MSSRMKIEENAGLPATIKERENVPICICSFLGDRHGFRRFRWRSFTEEVITPGEVTCKIFLNYTNPLDKQLVTPTTPRCN